MTGLPTKTRRAIAERDAGRCRRCGRPGNNVQHRIGKGMGGTSRPEVNDDLAALVTLCGSGTTGCHGHITSHPAEAYATGWAIRRSDPGRAADIPLVDLDGRQLYLGSNGDVTYVDQVTNLHPVDIALVRTCDQPGCINAATTPLGVLWFCGTHSEGRDA